MNSSISVASVLKALCPATEGQDAELAATLRQAFGVLSGQDLRLALAPETPARMIAAAAAPVAASARDVYASLGTYTTKPTEDTTAVP
ncbi:hypothetical protein [Nocardia sp. NPDC058114]|uniref:hypothetical protein n=1 Tax=Nocardia sp. NPDC058114 TaxID=3346346 RepID=UPI0036D875EB